MNMVLKNFRIVDETSDFSGSIVIKEGNITGVYNGKSAGAVEELERAALDAETVINGRGLVLMPAFVDLHAHFREAGEAETTFGKMPFPAETVESASCAAAAGGYGTVVCMANTLPVTDTVKRALAFKRRADALALIDAFPVISLTKDMKGKELSDIAGLERPSVLMASEDGKDIEDGALFAKALVHARRAGIPVSCHCDLDGEDMATERVLELARQTGARVHIAHISTGRAAGLVREAKKAGLPVSCEVTPHHLALNDRYTAENSGRVNPPLRSEENRLAVNAALLDGTIDAIATDHAPHTKEDKLAGAPGFSGLETAFAVCYGLLSAPGAESGPLSLSGLSSLMSASPARVLGLDGTRGAARGKITPGFRADLCAADLERKWLVENEALLSRGKNSPFAGKTLRGAVVLTIHAGRIVFDNRKKLI
jgi:dihydroorotase